MKFIWILFTKRDLTPNRRCAIILSTAFILGLTFTVIGEIMTPAENIYRSDYDEVDGVMELNCDDLPEDDGQPTIYDEYQDLYGGDDWDHGQYDDFEGGF
jgi:hypothetical protein